MLQGAILLFALGGEAFRRQQAIGLIKNNAFNLVRFHFAERDHVADAARRTYDDLRLFFQLIDLALHKGSPDE